MSGSAGNCYLIKDGHRHLMLEAGANPKNTRVNWANIDALLISHSHQDHAKFAKDYIKRGAFNIYATKGTANDLIGVPNYRVMTCEYLQQFTVKGWNIIPFRVEHDVSEPCGFLIQTPSGKKVLFATDTYYIRYKFKGITHFLIECNYSIDILMDNVAQGSIDKGQYKRILKSHFELNNLISFFEANDLSKAEEIHLIHLSDRNSDEQQFINEIEKVTGIPTYIAKEHEHGKIH